MRLFIPLLCALFVFVACQDNTVYIPKPRTYPRVEYPVRNYTDFNQQDCPFSMPYPDYLKYQKDTLSKYGGRMSECWFDLYSPDLKSYLYFSYVEIRDRKHFDSLVEDAFELVDKHNVKASYRDENKINSPFPDVHGLFFEISGPVATPLQFYLTDSTQHFLRGSLYFDAVVNRDSIAPVYAFVKEDLAKMFGGFNWTD